MSFSMVQRLLTVLILPFFGVLIGIGIFPGYLIFNAVENWSVSVGNDGLIHSLWFCIGLGMGYIAGGLGVVLVTGVFGAIFALRGREGRFPLKSMITIRWELHWFSIALPSCSCQRLYHPCFRLYTTN